MALDVLRSYMEVVPSKPEVHIKGVTLEAFDAVIQSQCREDESAPASIFALINTSPGVTCTFSTQPITF